MKGFWEHWDGQVLALRQKNQWTVDAPPSAYAPVVLRGYKMGQYLGKNMSSVEGEERLRLRRAGARQSSRVWPVSTGTAGTALTARISIPTGVRGSSTSSSRRKGWWRAWSTPRANGTITVSYLKMGYGF